MIVSFHPCIVGDRNLICAGRDPGPAEAEAIAGARAVVLPQGCRQSLYELAVRHCPKVFPNYRVRFDYPGKTGQSRLFDEMGVPHPKTWIFDDLDLSLEAVRCGSAPAFPFVLKFDWGGEGEGVFRIDSEKDLSAVAGRHRGSGTEPCLIQEYVPGTHRTLRVAVIGSAVLSYWRIAPEPDGFYTTLCRGARIEKTMDPALQKAGRAAVRRFCGRTGINLAGFDLLFSPDAEKPEPLFLEINYFFGRRGLGGSARFYALLEEQVRLWLIDPGTTAGTL